MTKAQTLTKEPHFDCAVIGGNISGSCMALALSHLGLSTCLIEPQQHRQTFTANTQQAYGLRVSAISPTSKAILSEMGCWQKMPTERIQPTRIMAVGEHNQWVYFDERRSPHASLADIVENQLLQTTLWQMLQQQPSRIDLSIYSSSLQSIEFAKSPHHRHRLQLDNSASMTCRLIIGADGANSVVRQQTNIAISQKQYQQHCFVGNVRPQLNHQQTAWQAYHRGLAIALLPHPDGSCSLAWYVDADEATLINSMDVSQMQVKLNQALHASGLTQLGSVRLDQPLQSFPIVRRRAQTYAKPGLLLIGDACRTIHPMAGQGLNLAITDVAVAIDLIQSLLKQSLPLNHPSLAKKYNTRRSEDRWVQYGMDAIDEWFKSPIIQPLRSIFLKALNHSPTIKKRMIHVASGGTQDIPKHLKFFQ